MDRLIVSMAGNLTHGTLITDTGPLTHWPHCRWSPGLMRSLLSLGTVCCCWRVILRRFEGTIIFYFAFFLTVTALSKHRDYHLSPGGTRSWVWGQIVVCLEQFHARGLWEEKQQDAAPRTDVRRWAVQWWASGACHYRLHPGSCCTVNMMKWKIIDLIRGVPGCLAAPRSTLSIWSHWTAHDGVTRDWWRWQRSC